MSKVTKSAEGHQHGRGFFTAPRKDDFAVEGIPHPYCAHLLPDHALPKPERPQLQRFPSLSFSPILPQPFGKLSPSESLFGEGGFIQTVGLKEEPQFRASAPLLAIDPEELFRTKRRSLKRDTTRVEKQKGTPFRRPFSSSNQRKRAGLSLIVFLKLPNGVPRPRRSKQGKPPIHRKPRGRTGRSGSVRATLLLDRGALPLRGRSRGLGPTR